MFASNRSLPLQRGTGRRNPQAYNTALSTGVLGELLCSRETGYRITTIGRSLGQARFKLPLDWASRYSAGLFGLVRKPISEFNREAIESRLPITDRHRPLFGHNRLNRIGGVNCLTNLRGISKEGNNPLPMRQLRFADGGILWIPDLGRTKMTVCQENPLQRLATGAGGVNLRYAKT